MALGRGVAETARLVASLELKDNLSRGIGSALGSVGRLESGLGRMGRGVGQVGSGLERLGTRAAIAAATGITAVVQASASFEQAFTGIEKTVDETANTTFPELEEAIRSMARSIPVSFEELAGIGEAGGALGIAADDLEDFIDVVARLSVSTNLSSDQAATALGQLGNVLHLSGGDFRDFADSLVALGNAGASTEDQIVSIAARFGAAGNAAGLSKEEILALSSAVASMGIQVESGGSALSRIFSSVATNIGTSSDKAVAFAKTLGLSAREFREAWERDALGTFQDFLTELNKLDQFEQASVLKDIGITNTRDVNTVRLMGQNVGFVADQLKIASDAQGALNEESQKFFDTATGQFKVLVNNARDAGVTIGNELLPIFKDLTKELTAFLNKPETRAALKDFGQDLAEGIRNVVAEIRKADFSGLIDGMKTAAQVAKAAFDIFHSLPPQVQALAISAIALNKVTGGAVGSIARGFGNIFAGALQTVLPRVLGDKLGGVLGGRGSSPVNPLFVSVVGGGLGGPGAPILGGAAGRGILGTFASLAGKAFAAATAVTLGVEIGKAIGHAVIDPQLKPAVDFETRQFEELLASKNTDRISHGLAAVEDGIDKLESGFLGGFFGNLFFGEQIDLLKQQRDALREWINLNRSTPQGQFTPLNPGGVPGTPTGRGPNAAGVVLPPNLFKAVGETIRIEERKSRQALKEGDLHTARIAQRQVDALNRLRGTFDRRINDLIPHLGRTNRALSVANRNLDDGNARQRLMDRHIEEARRAIGTGFQETDNGIRQTAATTHRHLSGIKREEQTTAGNTGKIASQGPPRVNVTVPVTTNVSISDIIRQATTYNVATSLGSQLRRGFTP